MIGALLLAAVAWAQDGASVPAVHADGFTPSPFAAETFAVDDSRPNRRASFRIIGGWGFEALVARPDDGSDPLKVVGNHMFFHATGGGQIGPVRLGATVPAYVVWSDVREEVRAFAGDPTFEAHLIALAAQGMAPGLFVIGRMTAPMGGSQFGMGYEHVTGNVELGLDARLGPVWLGLNAGYRILPEVRVGNLTWDDQVSLRFGVSGAPHPRWRISGELFGGIGVMHGVRAETSPFEAIVGASYRTKGGLEARLGVGVPVTSAPGVPTVRVMAAFGWQLDRAVDAKF